jgi:hypothetical protein
VGERRAPRLGIFRRLLRERLTIKGFEFEEGARKYTCTLQERKGANAASWWWFAVSGDMQSYAPFQAATTDTQANVQERVLAYYNNRLFQLTQPSQRNSHWGQRRGPVAAVASAVTDPVADAIVSEIEA